jgi:hypothetical protein
MSAAEVAATSTFTLSARGPRGQSHLQRQAPGGKASVVLGTEHVVYSCGTKESQYRVAVDAEAARITAEGSTAGARTMPEELGVRRRNGQLVHPSVPVGGFSSVQLQDGSGLGPSSYAEGIKEAQYAAALDPAAREESARTASAGGRVEQKWLGQSKRYSQPSGGGKATVSTDWQASLVHGAVPRASGNSPPPPSLSNGGQSPLKKEQPVGANSARFMSASAHSQAEASSAAGSVQQPVAVRSSRDSSIGFLLGEASGSSSSSSSGSSGEQQQQQQQHRSQLQQEQPLGGRGLLRVGIKGLEECDARIGARQA